MKALESTTPIDGVLRAGYATQEVDKFYAVLCWLHKHLANNEYGMQVLSDVGASKDVSSLMPTEVTVSSSW